MSRVFKIGTRDSKLALWQAYHIQDRLNERGVKTELVLMKSDGDINLVDPLYELGVQGIFTKTLDAALLSNRVDLAVHSFKDVPTQLPKGLKIAAVPPRGDWKDALVCKDPNILSRAANEDMVIATSSLRRKAQWLERFPHHKTANLRGNINTRLQKLNSENWDAALFAAVGIERVGLEVPHQICLDWMLPAPAQGALCVVTRESDAEALEVCKSLHDEMTFNCTHIERSFLRTLMGGCSMPIAGLAVPENDHIRFKGKVSSKDGREHVSVDLLIHPNDFAEGGAKAAQQLIEKGADKILNELRQENA